MDRIITINTYTVTHYGAEHTYIDDPGIANLWRSITGRKTINPEDRSQLDKLALLFGSEIEWNDDN